MRRFVFFLLFFLFSYGNIYGKTQWHYSVYPNSVSIGDKVNVKIFASTVSDTAVGYYWNVTAPEIVLTDKKITNEKKDYIISYTFAVFTTTEVTVKGVGFRIIPKKGKEKLYIINDLRIGFNSILKNGDKPLDIMPMVKIEKFRWQVVVFIGLIILLVVLIFVGRKIFAKKIEEKKEIVEDAPELVAEKLLYELLMSDIFKNRLWKKVFLKLTDIIRTYLFKSLHFRAQAETTFEILMELKLKKLDSSDYGMIKDFFEKSDLIKFAKYNPSDEEVDELISIAKKIIKLGVKY